MSNICEAESGTGAQKKKRRPSPGVPRTNVELEATLEFICTAFDSPKSATFAFQSSSNRMLLLFTSLVRKEVQES